MPRTRARLATALVVALVSATAFLAGGATASAHPAASTATTTRASATGPSGSAGRTTPVTVDRHASPHTVQVGAGGPAAPPPQTCDLPVHGRSVPATACARVPHEGTIRTTTDGRAPPA